ncbi:hypothetical protein E2C01_008682 [Portunus trituberculatus]|uniref:Uncharacterized protein n=1 Tax=Portunus trituberculatus TaxID=210409 RepID=A0A5B7D308_PORTR|nr:hypothetical protein [Portunus trituberculatus]
MNIQAKRWRSLRQPLSALLSARRSDVEYSFTTIQESRSLVGDVLRHCPICSRHPREAVIIWFGVLLHFEDEQISFHPANTRSQHNFKSFDMKSRILLTCQNK